MQINGVNFPLDEVGRLSRAAGVANLYLFGSMLTPTFRPDSDINLLAETDPASGAGLFRLGALQMDLSDLLGRTVHLTLLGGVPTEVRPGLLASARMLGAA